MKFVHDGKLIELHGDTIRDLHVVSLPQLRRMLQTDAVSEFFHIHVEPPPPTIPNPSLEIHSLLHKFAPIFQPPTTLPPSRPTDHYIHLHPIVSPVNVRPYRYPFYQKQEIEA